MKSRYILVGIILLALGLLLAACFSPTPAPVDTPTPCPTAAPCPECPPPPEPEPCPEPVVKDVPFEAMWAGSPHNAAETEAFAHWNESDPAEIPTSCAKCHSTPGYLDFLGEDGTAVGSVENAAPIGTTVTCIACHNATTAQMTSVTFPSGVEVSGLDASARCMVCHQGRASKLDTDSALEENGLTEDLDTVTESVGFVNIHYFAAAATLYGTETLGGYEYAGKTYDFKNDHVAGYDTCIGCHSPHTLELKVEECAVCHTGVASVEDLRNIRMAGSQVDYDGDGDIEEGIASEIAGLQEMLLSAIQAYGREVVGAPIAYDSARYPYFFADADANGKVDEAEELYTSWTGRLLKAAYNYQTSLKDPGAFAHGGKYIIQLLYDSIEDLNSVIASPVDLSSAQRIDAGHFAGSEEAFRHWDEDGEVEGGCARCHSAAGLPLYIEEGVNISEPLANGLNCATCHNDLSTFTRYEVGAVTFPSGASLDTGDSDANLCLNCHQGRESGATIANAISRAGVGDDEVSEALRFSNPHYFAAGATLFGADAAGMYEYEDKEYNGRNTHIEIFDTCVECHNTHALTVKVDSCVRCHSGVETQEDVQTIRAVRGGDATDYDGDGDVEEGVAGEVAGMAEATYVAMQAYATGTVGTGIVYNPAAYPYWFIDTNGNGIADPDESIRENGYAPWTPRLLKAAYNYQWVAKDPGAFAHNGKYVMQVLYDTLEDLGAAAGLTRPE